MSKQSNDPIDDCLSRSFAFCRRSRRNRSKSIRFSQSTAIVPCVLSPINQLLAASFWLLAQAEGETPSGQPAEPALSGRGDAVATFCCTVAALLLKPFLPSEPSHLPAAGKTEWGRASRPYASP